MKLLCIKDVKGKLTKNKLYEINFYDGGLSTIGGMPVYLVVTDSGYNNWVFQSNFISIEDEREKKLKKLGI